MAPKKTPAAPPRPSGRPKKLGPAGSTSCAMVSQAEVTVEEVSDEDDGQFRDQLGDSSALPEQISSTEPLVPPADPHVERAPIDSPVPSAAQPIVPGMSGSSMASPVGENPTVPSTDLTSNSISPEQITKPTEPFIGSQNPQLWVDIIQGNRLP